MLTPFGKAFRKLRIDHNETIKDAAKFLDVSVSYVSSVENGNRNIPQNWVDIIADHYSLSDEEYAKLDSSACVSPKFKKVSLEDMYQAMINLINHVIPEDSEMKKEAIEELERRFSELASKK